MEGAKQDMNGLHEAFNQCDYSSQEKSLDTFPLSWTIKQNAG